MNWEPPRVDQKIPPRDIWFARFLGMYTQPTTSEERFLQKLERRLDGEWIVTGKRITPEQAAHRKLMLDNYEEIHKYRLKFWSWKKGKRKSRPPRPNIPGLSQLSEPVA